jgi:hypothetical protein
LPLSPVMVTLTAALAPAGAMAATTRTADAASRALGLLRLDLKPASLCLDVLMRHGEHAWFPKVPLPVARLGAQE